MTALEIILIVILWIVYGIFSAYQDLKVNLNNYETTTYIIYIVFSPVILVWRGIVGIFHSKIFD